MLNVEALLSKLDDIGVVLCADGDRLHYEAPIGALTNAMRDELRARKDEILEYLSAWGARFLPTPPPITLAARGGDLPVSFPQQRMWFMDRLGAGAAYNSHLAWRLRGALDVDALQRSLDGIMRRHEILRTTFPSSGGRPVQRIAPTGRIRMSREDLGAVAAADREHELRRRVDAAVLEPFDLAKGPLLRCTLFRLGPDDHVLLLAMHHIITDGWSMGVLKRELSAHYRAFIADGTPQLQALPVQYADFAVWQRSWLQGPTLEPLLAYWRERLGPEVSQLDLPTDRPRLAVQSFDGGVVQFRVPSNLLADGTALGRGAQVISTNVLLAVFNVLLARYTRQDEITVGVPIANRNDTEIEGLVGLFVNSLVLRNDLSGDPTFAELLARVQSVSVGAYDHQDLPFERLVDELKPKRDPGRNPLVQIMFAMQNAPSVELDLPGVQVRPFDIRAMTTRFDLEVHVDAEDDGFRVQMIYAEQLFDAETIERMGRHYMRLLEAAIRTPDQPISALSWIDAAERRQVLEDWNDTAAEYPHDTCVHELVEAQVARTPDAIAVEYDDRWTYGELDQRANQIARYLQTLGVGRGTMVGVCLERSEAMVAAMLGILKAGAAYVPLDPAYPAERLHFILADTAAPVVLTTSALGGPLEASKAQLVCLDTEADAIADYPVTPPASGASAGDTAYVIYTSGSTGRAKGVCVPHRAISRLVVNTDYVQLQDTDRIAQASNANFDAATFEIWGALIHGARLVGVTKDALLSAQLLAEHVRDRGINVMFITTSLFNGLVQEIPGFFAGFRYVLFGGQAVDPRWPRAALQHGAPEHLLHVYGPTETTTFATWYEITDVPADATTIPIGRGLANTTAYVLDPHMQPAPIGVTGELFIGGPGVATGYLHRPELTAEKYVSDPFSDAPGARLYRTGDLVRWTAAGSIEFIGRVDHQVKVRGFRIELGEIESTLTQHEDVNAAVVAVHAEASGDKRLVAYVVPESAHLRVPVLRDYIAGRLPDYMMPSAFVMLDAFPLTPNGKVDRRALPAPDFVRSEMSSEYAAPRTPVEEQLAEIWSDVLEIECPGTRDSFFELGGHSLLATQVVSRIREAFDIEMPLQTLFEHPTIEGLAGFVQRPETEALRSAPITPLPRDGELPLSFAQQRLWFLDQLYPGRFDYNQAMALRLRGELDLVALARSLDELVRRHETLRTAILSEDGVPKQVILETASRELPLVDLTDLPAAPREAAARQLAGEELRCPFDLSAGAPMRAQVIRLDDRDHVLLLTLHHIVSDGWSLGVLHRELGAIYTAFVRGEPSPLEPLDVQYADFAAWQRQWLTGHVWDEQMGYWMTELDDVAPLELPTDRSRPAEQTFWAARERIVLPKRLADAIDDLGRRENATPFMTMLAAFAVLLRRYSGQDDIVVGSPIANRNRIEVEPLIGFFVNSLVMRTDLSGDPSFQELVSRVRRTALGAYAHQDLPFERLVEEFNPERDRSRSPLFQIMFAMQNAPPAELVMPGLEVCPFDSGLIATRFDIEFHIHSEAGGYCIRMLYAEQLFDRETIDRMSRHFVRLLEEAVRRPEARISGLGLLDPSERRQLIEEWNDTTVEYPATSCVHELFEQQAATTPDAIALSCDGTTVTYDELNRRANQVAHALRRRDVGPEVMIGLCVERSVEMVVGVLGILKAGGAYVPLDSSYPASRLALMLEDTEAQVLLTQASLVNALPSYEGEVIRLDTDWEGIAAEPDANPPASAVAGNLAYVMYTSGSTGRPKGVCVTHRSIVRLVRNTNYIDVGPDDVYLSFAPISFDASTLELWGSLLNGAKLVLFPSHAPSLGELGRVIETAGVTTLWMTSTLFQQMVDAEPERLRGVRQLLAGGDALSVPHLKRAIETLGGDRRLINGYGPTENTTFTCCHVMDADSVIERTVPIGRPIANTQVYLLDAAMNPVPVGVAGELYTGGHGLARGYLNDAALTAAKFVPNPFGEPGSRLYRTGDQSRYRADGTIEFVGRIDHQVKVRGYRIELGEIEAVLNELDLVRSSVVTVRDEDGDKRIVAYAVPELDLDAEETSAETENRVQQWQDVYEDVIYRDIGEGLTAQNDAAFNIVGWNSTYTEQPLGADVMREQVDQTLARIRPGRPDRVLEIGCGTGMLLLPIAPDCSAYLATDFSRSALDYVRRHLDELGPRGDAVKLWQRGADDFTGIDDAAFDLVVINSVIQYFPSIDYLDDVLGGAIRAVAPGGRVLVGDVRNLPLLEAFHSSVQRFQADPDDTAAQLRQRIQHQLIHEQELVIDPEYFVRLATQEPRITYVQIMLKRGHAINELTKYRYDVIMHVEQTAPAVQPEEWIDWEQSSLSLDDLRRRLAEHPDRPLGVRRVPNARLRHDLATVEAIAIADPGDRIGHVARDVHRAVADVDPAALWALADELACDATIGWSDSGPGGRFDAIFVPRGVAGVPMTPMGTTAPRPRDRRSYATMPLRAKMMNRLVPELRECVSERLPEYMMPSAFVVLDELPLTPNGKVDRAALPAPDVLRQDLSSAYEAPRTSVEETLAGIWSEILGVERVGIRDDFFELGGHSLLATQVISRVRAVFEQEVPLQAIFDGATVEKLAAVIDGARVEALAAPPIVSVAREADHPLSFAQQRLWFIEQLYPDGAGYHSPLALRLRGALDVEALRRSFDALVRRHEVLRTTFRDVEGTPRQVIGRPNGAPFEFVDLTSLPEEKRETEARGVSLEHLNRPFDLSRDPLMRTWLLRLGERDHVLLVVLHHIVIDGWSIGVLKRELGAVYAAFASGDSSPLPPLTVQYADFAAWQRSWMSGEVVEDQLEYWRRALAGIGQLELPTDRPRPLKQTFGAAHVERTLPADLWGELEALSRREGATVFMTLLAALSILLQRYARTDDVAVGSPIANRNRVETEGMIGFFVNTLVMRTDLSGSPSFRELMSRVRSAALGAYQHQDLPFEKLVDELQPERDLSRNPLFQVLFAVQNAPGDELDLPDLEIARFDLGIGSTRFDLELHVWELARGPTARFIYNTDLFDAAMIERMVRHYCHLLEAIVAHPDRCIDRLPMTDDVERRQILVEWNDTRRDFPRDRRAHELFEAQASATPDGLALVFEDRQMKYGELNARANQLARLLREHGVGPDVPVGICLERGAEMVISVLAVLKAGGAYVPLDREYPRHRLAAMLENVRAPVLLTQRDLLESLPPFEKTTILLDSNAQAIRRQSDENLDPLATPGNLAYVVYTSGSTGRPKGVAMPHAPLVNLIDWQMRASAPGAAARTLQFAPFSFDVSFQEMFATLGAGGTLLLISEQLRRDPAALLRFLREQKATRMFLPFVGLRQLAEVADDLDVLPEALREIVTAGEQLQITPAVVRFMKRMPACTLINQYGPAECHVVSAESLDPSAPERWPALPPIGRPIANTRIHLLDRIGGPVPVGVPGELYVGGTAVSHGYLHAPELTAERFVPDPFSEKGGERLYRTGDLARYLPDGTIEFLGRADHQIKLRGYRIEPGEIESILATHPAVRQAVAVLADERSDSRRLVAYVVTDEATPDSLRAFLKERLADYMMPSAYVVLDALPLTPSGKVDRRALRAPSGERQSDTAYIAPRSEIERQIAAVWREVLGVDQVGIHDDFFELGGHSLLATQVISRVRTVFEQDISLSMLFEHQTIAKLAAAVTGDVPDAELVPLVMTPRGGALPLSVAQQRMWILDQLGRGDAYNMSTAVRAIGRLDVPVLERSLVSIARRHEVLRTTFRSTDGKPFLSIAPEPDVRLVVIERTGLSAEQRDDVISELASAEAQIRFELTRGPLMRAKLIRFGEDDHLILFTFHHIISDGWSEGIFRQELLNHYRAFTEDVTPDVPELLVQYVDFAAWQVARLKSADIERQLTYWRAKLRDLPALDLPVDRRRPPAMALRGGAIEALISQPIVRAVRALGRQEGATPMVVLLAAFKVVLARYSGQDDVVVGSLIANRDHPDIEKLIGLFVNALVLRTDLSDDPTFCELMQKVKKTLVEAYAHQDIPFERLVAEHEPTRDPSRNPLFQVGFALHNMPYVDLELPGVSLTPVRLHVNAARVDLELHLFERGDVIMARAVYNSDLFDGATIDRLLDQFITLLEAACRDPYARLSALPMQALEECQEAMLAWNETSTTYPRDVCIHELFEAQAASRPNAVGVSLGDETLTYGELNRRANQLAHHLIARGVGPETMVGICVERSLEMVVGILGILKAGGAYVPLATDYPVKRLAVMLEDTRAPVVLIQGHLRETLPVTDALADVEIIELDGDWATIAKNPDSDPPNRATADGLAYVMYTSGSTGRPKGTAVVHRGVVRLVRETNYMSFGPDEVFLQLAPISFDASTLELWGALLNGGKVLVFPPGRPSLADLATAIRDGGVTSLWLTAALFHEMVDAELASLCGVRQLLSGGDVLSVPHVTRVLEALPPGGRLINGYGPTENTTFTCCHVMTKGDAIGATVPIGRPIANTRVYVVDRHLQPVPIGVYGELLIGGDGLSRSYWNEPALTAERFVPDPFGPPGERLYRTGDLVRWCADGTIEFRGRLDHQVKVRGYRIELGEIESVLREHPAIGDATAALFGDDDEAKRIAAYVVPAEEPQKPVADDVWRESIEREHIDEWQTLYELTYEKPAAEDDETFNIVGWESSYTGEPIPAEQMEEWVDATVARIRSCRPRRVLEIGCGSGLLLHRVAPECERYVGTDFSETVLRQLQASVDARGLDQVELMQRMADDFSGIEPGSFDTVIINSVVQYFPSADYLVSVLRGAAAALADGGHIFVGDVRNLPLLQAFHAAVELHRADDGMPTSDLEREIRDRADLEAELVIDPALFSALREILPRLDRVQVLLKHGRHHNELTQFRYDVILNLQSKDPHTRIERWVDWQDEGLTLEALAHTLETSPRAIGLVRVPNARVRRASLLLASLADEDRPEHVGGLLETIDRAPAGVDPAALHAVAAEHGYSVELSDSQRGDRGMMDAVLWRPDAAIAAGATSAPDFPAPPVSSPPRWRDYANNPLRGLMARHLVPKLRAFIAERLPDYMMPSTFVILESLPKTPSGKLDRRALPEPDRLRSEAAGDYVAPRGPVEERLARIWSDILRLERVGIHDNFFHLGGDSILSIQICSRARNVGLYVTPQQIFEQQTIAALVVCARVGRTPVNEVATQEAIDSEVGTPIPLTPVQRWFFDKDLSDPHHFNHALLLTLKADVAPEVVRAVIAKIIRHHDALRLRFKREETGQWVQVTTHPPAGDDVPFTVIDLSDRTDADRAAAIEAVADRVQASLDIEHGPLLRVAMIDVGRGQPKRLLWVIHHLATDGVSWRILLDDFELACTRCASGKPVRFPAKTMSYQRWACKLVDLARSDQLDGELDTWLGIAAEGTVEIPIDHADGENTTEWEREQSFALSVERTRVLLQDVPRAYNTRINDVLLAAFTMAYGRWSGHSHLRFDMEGHGREELLGGENVGRTVGWFTAIYPVALRVIAPSDPAETLKSVKEQLRGLPHRCIGYGVLRYLRSEDEATDFRTTATSTISFNYLGQVDRLDGDGLFDSALESAGASSSPRNERTHLLAVGMVVSQGQLRASLRYSAAVHEPGTVDRLRRHFEDALDEVIEHCTAVGTGGYTPADFPLAVIDQADLDRLVARYGRDEIEDVYAMTPMQQGIRFHTLRDAAANAYIQQLRQRISGLDVSTLVEAWQQTIDRHTALRTSIEPLRRAEPVQVVHRHARLPVVHHDLRSLVPAEREAWIERFEVEDLRRGLDLESPVLMRLAFLRVDDDAYVFVLTFHHIAIDGWSLGLILSDAAMCYGTLACGERPCVDPAPAYREYIAWFKKQELREAETFWRDRLAGIESSPLLVSDPPRELADREELYREHRSYSSESLAERMRLCARQCGITPNTLAVGAWGLLMCRYTGSEDIILGTIVSGRPAEIQDVERMVGLLINVLPLRVTINANEPASSWLRALQDDQITQRMFEYSPLWQVQQWSELPAGKPLFDTLFAFQNYPSVRSSPRGLSGWSVELPPDRTGYPLTVSTALRERMMLRMSYERDRLDGSTIECMSRHYWMLLEQITTHVDARIGSFSLTTPEERRFVVDEFNATARDYPKDRFAHELFEEAVDQGPDRVALSFDEIEVTYGQLDALANQLAHRLRRLGVGSSSAVLIRMDCSIEMVVAFLGVLKAGGTYVLLAPSHSPALLSFLIKDTAAVVVLTRSDNAEPADDATLAYLDDATTDLAGEPTARPQATAEPEGLASVLYHSGSDGRPRGVAIAHRGLVNYLSWCRETYALGPGDVTLVHAPMIFDPALTGLLAALAAGGRVRLVHGAQGIGELVRAIRAEDSVGLVRITPAYLQSLGDRLGENERCRLRTVVIADGQLSAEHVSVWRGRNATTRLLNEYRPSETFVSTCVHEIPSDYHGEGAIPIGQPIANTRLFVLDERMSAAPVGVSGELYVGGVEVAREYINKAELTAERFVPDPFAAEPGSRLYRTGDRARFLPDGVLELVSRRGRKGLKTGGLGELSDAGLFGWGSDAKR